MCGVCVFGGVLHCCPGGARPGHVYVFRLRILVPLVKRGTLRGHRRLGCACFTLLSVLYQASLLDHSIFLFFFFPQNRCLTAFGQMPTQLMCTYDYGALPLFLSRVLQATPPLLELYACGSGHVECTSRSQKAAAGTFLRCNAFGRTPFLASLPSGQGSGRPCKGNRSQRGPEARVWNSHEVAPMFCMFNLGFRGGKHSAGNEVVATAKVKWESVE